MRRTSLLIAMIALGPTGVARADVAPPADYVDPCASINFDEKCDRCTAPEFKARDCHEGAQRAGKVERCRGWSYTMYCPEGWSEAAAPTPPLDVAPAPTLAPPPTPPTAPTPPPSSPPLADPPKDGPLTRTPEAASSGCSIGDSRELAGLVSLALVVVAGLRRRSIRRA